MIQKMLAVYKLRLSLDFLSLFGENGDYGGINLSIACKRTFRNKPRRRSARLKVRVRKDARDTSVAKPSTTTHQRRQTVIEAYPERYLQWILPSLLKM